MANILVVDENEAVRKRLRGMLQLEGHEVVEAGNDSETLSRLRAAPVDLAFVDRTILDRDVGELLRRMRQDFGTTKICAISTMIMSQYVAHDLPGMVGCLTTPFTEVDVRAVLRSAGMSTDSDD